MQRNRLILIFCLCQVLAGAITNAQVISIKDLHDDPDGMPNERILRQAVDVGTGIKLTAVINESTKGNGMLHVGSVGLKVVDEHDDGAVYAGAMPHVEFVDIDQDGIKELIVSGIVKYTDEKSDVVHDREEFVFIYRYDLKQKDFKLAYKHASFALETGPQARV